jgi:hypothetical protein
MSSGRTDRKAAPIASDNASVVRAAADFRTVFTFDHNSSIGVRSELYGGNGTNSAPAFSIRWNPPPLAVRLLQALPFPAWIETAPIEEGTEGYEDGHVRRGRVDPT